MSVRDYAIGLANHNVATKVATGNLSEAVLLTLIVAACVTRANIKA